MEEKLNDQMLIRRGKLEKIAALGFEPYGGKYECTHHSEDIHADAAALEASGEHVKVAGRIMIIRGHGKTAFCTLRDEKGDIQLYFRKDTVSENEWNLFKLVDMGDILGVEGTVFTTHTGETTIRVLHFTMLSKSLRPLPEKWHGLTDKEQRYRQRYLDLIANPDVRKTFIKRANMLQAIRNWYTTHGFLEVETPVLQPLYGGANARPFMTHFNALDMTMYLRIAPELYLRDFLSAGMNAYLKSPAISAMKAWIPVIIRSLPLLKHTRLMAISMMSLTRRNRSWQPALWLLTALRNSPMKEQK